MAKDLHDKHPNYYESLLQLRDISEEVIQFTEKEMKKSGLIIAKVKYLPTGVDYYTADNDLTRKIGKKIHQHFDGHLEITATLHTKKKDKELHRLTILFRQAPFQKNDQVEYRGEIYSIKSMVKDIFLQQVNTGKKVHLKIKDMAQIKLVKQE